MNTFSAVRIVRTASIRLAAPPEIVFPLFGPLEEQRWAADWRPAFLYPPSGQAQRNAVFVADHGDGTPAIWTIVEYAPAAYRIAYLRVHPATHVARIDIGCTADGEGATRADVAYTFTGLSAPGNAYIETFSEEYYAAWLRAWEEAINHYLRHGQAPRHHGAH